MSDDKSQTETASNNKMAPYKRKRIVIPVIVTLLAACLVVAYWYMYLRGYISTDDAYIDSDPIVVSSKILGRVVSLGAQEGDTVKQGQLLVQMDDSDLRAQEAQAKAALEYTRQNVPLAKISLDRAEDDLKRSTMQIKDDVITKEQFEHARKALEMAQAQYKVAQSQINSSEAQLGVIETQLRNMRIEAPPFGIVARRWVGPGDIVQAGQPIFTIYDLSNVWVTANFEETKLPSIHIGDPVRISVDAYPDLVLDGKVATISPVAASEFSLIPPNNASGNFTKVTQRVPVKIALSDPPAGKSQERLPLRPGMSVEVKIIESTK